MFKQIWHPEMIEPHILQRSGKEKMGDGSWARARRECGILTNYRLSLERRSAK